jgi:cytochrome P450
VLGLPEADADLLHQWIVSQFTETAAAASGTRYNVIGDLDAEFREYLIGNIVSRRSDTGPDDAIGRMIEFRRDDGSAFTDEEIAVQVRVLIAAGNETTTSLMSNLVYRLLEQPGLYERVADDRSLLVPAIEESLRLDAPLQVLIRRATTDSAVGGVTIAANNVVAVSTLSSNRDERVWGGSAGQFDIERFAGGNDVSHLGFGLGIHHCVGAYLARQTTLHAVNALLDAVPTMRLEDGYAYENVFRHVFHRPRCLPVRFPV